MTKVKSISIEGGAANPIADKGLDEALAETTMAATDSIPVKKAGGGFVYLDKNSLVSAVCQAFGIPAKNNNIGTALTHILGFNSGNGAGVATLADVAQVLGVPTFIQGMATGAMTGDTVSALKSFVDNSLSDSWSIRLIHVNANVHGVAIGLKLSSDYSSFIVFSYNGDINLVYKSAGLWYEKAL